MITIILVAASMCLQGGEQVDLSRFVSPAAGLLGLKVTLSPAGGVVLIYSPGYEERQARFTQEQSFAWIPFADPVLCIKTIGGPFEFDIDILPIEDVD